MLKESMKVLRFQIKVDKILTCGLSKLNAR